MKGSGMRQGQFPYRTEVRPTQGGGVFREEWERGEGKAGGSYASLMGLYDLPPRWSHVQPFGAANPARAPAVSAAQQMLWLAQPAVPDDGADEFQWNAAVAALPSLAATPFYQIDCSYCGGLLDLTSTADAPASKGPAFGLLLGNAALAQPGWTDPFYFSNTIWDDDGIITPPQLWTDGQTLNSESLTELESSGSARVYLTVTIVREGADWRILTYGSIDGVSKMLIADQVLEDFDITHIGFAVRATRPIEGEIGWPSSAWFNYLRMRRGDEGLVGVVTFGQTGGRNWG